MAVTRPVQAVLVGVLGLALLGGIGGLIYLASKGGAPPEGIAADPKAPAAAEPAKPTVAANPAPSPSPDPTSKPDIPKPAPSPKDVAKPATPNPRPTDAKPRVWAIVVGIDGYDDIEGIPVGRGGEFGARAFANWLRESGGWEESNILKLVDSGVQRAVDAGPHDQTGHFPSLGNLRRAFSEWLPARIRPGDVVVFYFGGQMVALPPAPGSVPGAAGRGFLLAIDSRAASADMTGFALETALDELSRKGENKIVCFLDSSLHGRGRVVKSTLAAPKPDDLGFLRTVTRWPGVSVWLASLGRPSSQPTAAGQNSPFTEALLRSFGARTEPYSLLDSLSNLQRDASMLGSGFKHQGSIDAETTLWSSDLKLAPPRSPEMLIQRGHARSVNQIDFQTDGALLATGSDDSTVRIWRVQDRRLLRVLDRHLHGVSTVAFADSGAYVAGGDNQGSVQVWDTRNRMFLVREALPEHSAPVVSAQFLPETDRLLTRDSSGTVCLTGFHGLNAGTKKVAFDSVAVAGGTAFGPVAFAVVGRDGKIQRFGRDAATLPKVVDGPGGLVDGGRLACDGKRIACADAQGKLVLWDEPSAKLLHNAKIAESVDRIAFQGDRLIAASGGKLLLFRIRDGKLVSVGETSLPQTVTNLVLSAAGDLFAARCNGAFGVWRWTDAPAPEPIALDGEPGLVTSVAISPDGRTLAAGNQDGGVRFWDLAKGEQRSPVPSRRGQIASLGVSEDGRFLLQVTFDRTAQLWDLVEGRHLVALPPPITPGTAVSEGWASGLVSADGKNLIMTTAPDGDIVVLDRATLTGRVAGDARPTPFARPLDPEAGDAPVKGPFKNLTLYEGPGRKLVAASVGTVACVWDYLTGSLIYTIRGHDDTIGLIRSIDFSADAKYLATAGEDAAVHVWDLSTPNPQDPKQPNRAALFTLPKENTHATAVKFVPSADPKAPPRLAVGTRDGDLQLWRLGEAKPGFDFIAGGPAVTALALTSDKKYLAASFRDKSIRHWRIAPTIVAQGLLAPQPNHDEEINALAAWPGRPVVATGSDDTTIRLWDLAERRLLGTLSAGEGESDWVAYAPNGRFDCAVGAERQLTWLRNNEVFPIEQFGESLRIPGLPGMISKGDPIPEPVVAAAERPRIAIDPPAAVKAESEKLELSLKLSTPGVLDLRLYQDGIPIRDASDFKLAPDGRTATIDVALHNGVNKFYAMAGLPGAIDGRSNDVEVRWDAPDPPGELHILALGVGEYQDKDHRLKYAKKDADDLSEFLKTKGLKGNTGMTIVLRDDDVSGPNVQDKLTALRRRVRNRPQDTVAVFLAGHTDVVADRFSLLRTNFLFSKRGQNTEDAVIPFQTIYQYVAYLGCQQRLMIVDACRSGEILKDQGVQFIRRKLDSDAHKGRTSYILAAARPGSIAGESDALEHGLLTYSLLKGMGAAGLKDVKFTDVFEKNKTADRDKNKVVDAEELSWYADLTVPTLAAKVPLLVQRSGVSRGTAPRPTNTDRKSPAPPLPSAIPLVAVP